jgi:hypothetical protein
MAVCLRCGYDLRATAVDASCPECGLAAHRSVVVHEHPDDCPPGWVASIAIAARMLLVAYCSAGLILALITLAMDGIWSGRLRNSGMQLAFAEILVVWVLVVHAIAVVMVTRDEKGRVVSGLLRVQRWALRFAAIVPVLGFGLGFCLYWTPWIRSAVFGMDPGLIAWSMILPLLVCPALTFFRFWELAVRMSRPRLAEHVTIVAAGSAASLVFVVVATMVTRNSWVHGAVYLFVMLLMPWVFVWLFDLWALLLLFVVVRKFSESAKVALERWNAADASMGADGKELGKSDTIWG